MSRPETTRVLLPLAAIYLLALLVQILYVLSIRGEPTFRSPIVDGAVYLADARAFRESGSLPEAPFRYAPLYPVLLGIWHALAGGDLLATHILQVLFSSLAAPLAALLATAVFGRAEGILAGLLSALYWPFLYFGGELLSEPVFLPILLGFLVLVAREGGKRRTLGAGILLGIASAARPNALLLLPAFALREIIRRRVRRGLLLAAGCAIPLLPVFAYNLAAGKDAVLVSTSAGINFYIGNNEHANGRDSDFPGIVQWTFEKIHRLAEIEKGRPLRPSEVSGFYMRKGLAFAAEKPGAFLALNARKLAHLFSSYEIPNIEDPNFYRGRSRILSFPLLFSFGIVAPLAVAGILGRRRREREGPLLLAGAVYVFSIVLFFVNARYRLPLVPILVVYASAGLAAIVRARRGPRGTLVRLLALLAAALLLVNWNPSEPERDESQTRFNEGWAAQKNGDFERALEEYARVDRSSDWYAPALNNRAVLEMTRDDLDAAIEDLLHAVAIDSTYFDAWSNLGRACYRAGRMREAAEAFERAARLWPHDPSFHANLGLARKAEGDLEGAARAFGAALEADETYRSARLHLAEILLAGERPAEALPHLERALREERGDAAARWLLGNALAGVGRTEEAEAAWREVLRIAPGSPLAERARAALGSDPPGD
ncbi:MAG: tetratricopeptide repeat protein [Candidatus Eisenbacteria bacterium]|nr:tetratricopeptide repeat protein [Candidatus Eisenbacteria bacterium]